MWALSNSGGARDIMCLIIRVFLFPCLHWRRSKKLHILIFEAFDANLVVAEAEPSDIYSLVPH